MVGGRKNAVGVGDVAAAEHVNISRGHVMLTRSRKGKCAREALSVSYSQATFAPRTSYGRIEAHKQLVIDAAE